MEPNVKNPIKETDPEQRAVDGQHGRTKADVSDAAHALLQMVKGPGHRVRRFNDEPQLGVLFVLGA